MEPQKKTPVKDVFLRTIAVLGLIAILLLGAWGIIQLAFALPEAFGTAGSGISSLFTSHPSTATSTSSKESLAVSMQGSINSGQTLQVAWTHSNASTAGQYSYAISYACQPNLTVKAPLPTGAYQNVPCNTPFNYVNATAHMNVVPMVTGSMSMPLTVTVVATKLSTGAVTATGSATSNVAFAQGATQTTTTSKPATTTTKPATTYVPAATRPATLYGYGDLAVTITSVAPSVSGTTIKFTIANTGTNVINPGWTFNASLPINGSYSFASQPQQAMYPGDKIVYTLSFAGGNSGYNTTYPYGTNYGTGYPTTGYTSTGYNCDGYSCSNNNYVSNGYPYSTGYNYGYQQTGVVTITADPLNLIPELNKNNNFAQTTVVVY